MQIGDGTKRNAPTGIDPRISGAVGDQVGDRNRQTSKICLRYKQLDRCAGGAGGIRTLDRALQPYNGLANRRLQPLGHSSVVMYQAHSPGSGGLKSQIAAGLPPENRDYRSFLT